jgi:hypothetical protein
MQYVFKGIPPAMSVFQDGDRLSLFQIGLFSCDEKTHVSFESKPFGPEAGTSSTLFPCEN